MHTITVGTIIFPGLKLDKGLIPAFRGAVAEQFRQFDLLHNHTPDGRVLYRYAAIQFKVLNQHPVIYAIGEKAVSLFKPLFLNLDSVNLNGTLYTIADRKLSVDSFKTGLSDTDTDTVYRFQSPWIALNQANHREYLARPERTAQGRCHQ